MDPQLEAKERTREWLKDTYRKELGREAKEEGIQYWMDDIYKRGGNQNQVLSNIRRSDEKWLGDTFKAELGRELGEEGREYWMGDFRGKGSGLEDLNYGQDDRPVQSREQVLANIRRNDEYKDYQGGADPVGSPADLPETTPPPEETPSSPQDTPQDTPAPTYSRTPDLSRKYNTVYDSVDAAAETGNRMTDEFYNRFLPQQRAKVLLGAKEIGESQSHHMKRYKGTIPSLIDPKELFNYYKGATSNDSDDSSESNVSLLTKRIEELEKKYGI
tara:strand:+ start:1518 stop:2336 length:819 start_codon:yes stop_codon:yes gene_type:complete